MEELNDREYYHHHRGRGADQKLQEQIASLKETTDCIIAVNDIDEYENGEPITVVKTEIAMAKIDTIKHTFSEREKTLQSLLDLYKIMYSDLKQDNAANTL